MVAAAATVFTAAIPAASIAVAAPGADPILDVEADVATITVGTTVTLTATIYASDGTTVLTGPGSLQRRVQRQQVRPAQW